MPSEAIDEERLPTNAAAIDPLHGAETPPRRSSFSSSDRCRRRVMNGKQFLDPEDLDGSIVQTTLSDDYNSKSKESLMIQGMMLDLKQHIDKTTVEVRDQSRRDFEKVVMVMQQESTKRAAMEQRLHSQLLLQNESMVAMELKLLRLEAKVERRDAAQRQQRSRNNAIATIRTIDEVESHSLSTGTRASEPTNIAVHSSGASLASGVTEELGEDDEEEVGSQQSTPTLGSRPAPRITGGALGSILLNPMMGETSVLGHSLRATRGDFDGNSSLGTSVTGSTMTSTILPSRGESIRGRYFLQDPDSRRTTSALTDDTFFSSANEARPRSRSNSPLSVQSQAMASEASQSTAIMSSVAVAAPRSRRATRMEASLGEESRPLANRVVSFTTDILQNQPQNMNENCDSITMPDELDNLSEVADAFSSSGRSWREDYEARLDALQKRWANE